MSFLSLSMKRMITWASPTLAASWMVSTVTALTSSRAFRMTSPTSNQDAKIYNHYPYS